MDYVCITLVVCNTVRGMFLVCGLHKLEFKTCLDSWSAWRLALDSVEQSQNSCVIIGLGQERYAEKPITYFPLQVSISYTKRVCARGRKEEAAQERKRRERATKTEPLREKRRQPRESFVRGEENKKERVEYCHI